ncbi:MAG TPA: hypothetical protein VM164_11200 [Burkholderiales bacterium]|nr:hypothetical protein [Burkholderiales bacterium]
MKTASLAPEMRLPPGAQRDIPPFPDEFAPRRRVPMKRDWVWWSLAFGFSGMGTAFLALVWIARHLS